MFTRLFKSKPYRGGPLFESPSTHCFDLEGTGLELTVPASTWVMDEPPRMLNLPFLNAGWFDAHCKRRNIHEQISVFGEVWPYSPKGVERIFNLLAMGSNDRFGALCFFAHLNRTEKGRKLDLGDQQSLGTYIKWEYDDYFESPEQGLYAKGENYKVRQECERKYSKEERAYNPASQQRYEVALERLEPMPQDLELVDFGGAQWTHFTLKKRRNRSEYYCLPLAELYYLEIEIAFKLETSLEKLHAVLLPDMQRTADWLLQHIKITSPNHPSGPVASLKG